MLNTGSVDEATDFLLQHWPDETERKYKAARRTCLDALQRHHAACEAGMAAAKEADIYVGERTPTPASP
ncbi:DUF982 domain-containing protein [Phyllobacterium trifolii]|uniref:DUF982 domain-containing protein n=1 Tax=Phyllobacterium trifolii TaxID=300193 RepID=UPI0035E418C0